MIGLIKAFLVAVAAYLNYKVETDAVDRYQKAQAKLRSLNKDIDEARSKALEGGSDSHTWTQRGDELLAEYEQTARESKYLLARLPYPSRKSDDSDG